MKSHWEGSVQASHPSKNTIVPPWRDMQSHGKPSNIFAEIIPERHRNVKGSLGLGDFHIVRHDRVPEPLHLNNPHLLKVHQALDLAVRSLADQDLAGFGERFQSGGQ